MKTLLQPSLTTEQQRNLKQYIQVLRSGKYKQIKQCMHNGRGGYCAVGLMGCPDMEHIGPYYATAMGLDSFACLRISNRNDEGSTFPQIADMLEKELNEKYAP